MYRRIAMLGFGCMLIGSIAAAGQDKPSARTVNTSRDEPASTDLPATQLLVQPVEAPRKIHPFPDGLMNMIPAERPGVLPALYASFVGLEAYDGYSTLHGTAAGAAEANPLLRGFTDRPAVVWAVKGAAAFTSIYIAERLWRQRHRTGAITVMIVANGIMAGVAARNLSVIPAQR